MNIQSSSANAMQLTKLNRQRAAQPTTWDSQLNKAVGDVRQPKTLLLGGPGPLNGATVRPQISPGRPQFPQALNAPAAPRPATAVATKPDQPRDEQLEQSAQTLVNQFFMGTMLKQMRESPFKDETFSGGKAGEAYAGMFDQHVSEHAGNRIARDLVGSMVKRYKQAGAVVGPQAFPMNPQPAQSETKRASNDSAATLQASTIALTA